MIKPKLHHVTLKTSHLDKMIAWYGKVIGNKVQFRDQVAAWTTNDTANHRIAFLAVRGRAPPRRRPLFSRTCVSCGRRLSLASTVWRLRYEHGDRRRG
jgi:catechol-2,3-dioxygenase